VSFVGVIEVAAESSPYELVATAEIVSAPSSRPLRSSPVNDTLPAPAVAAVEAVTSCAGVPSETVKLTVSVASDVAGRVTSTLTLVTLAALM
jgi:hypothetical protein